MTRKRPTTAVRGVACGRCLLTRQLAELRLDFLPVAFDHVSVLRFLTQGRIAIALLRRTPGIWPWIWLPKDSCRGDHLTDALVGSAMQVAELLMNLVFAGRPRRGCECATMRRVPAVNH